MLNNVSRAPSESPARLKSFNSSSVLNSRSASYFGPFLPPPPEYFAVALNLDLTISSKSGKGVERGTTSNFAVPGDVLPSPFLSKCALTLTELLIPPTWGLLLLLLLLMVGLLLLLCEIFDLSFCGFNAITIPVDGSLAVSVTERNLVPLLEVVVEVAAAVELVLLLLSVWRSRATTRSADGCSKCNCACSFTNRLSSRITFRINACRPIRTSIPVTSTASSLSCTLSSVGDWFASLASLLYMILSDSLLLSLSSLPLLLSLLSLLSSSSPSLSLLSPSSPS
mmetsp:Transcript_95691/g.187872  ORF Transcript_95691/g.187872 Transcript_95691/m.187872 type:complete len:282 (+) Transcript_95691:322-1167(+)